MTAGLAALWIGAAVLLTIFVLFLAERWFDR